MANDGGKGASESLNLTISDIMDFLGDDGYRPGPQSGEKLRPFLEKKLGDFAELWLQRGFKAGHLAAYETFEKANFPKKVELVVKKGTGRSKIAPNHERDLHLKSTLKKSK